MAFNEFLGKRIKNLLERESIEHLEKRMFGGLCFMINNKMSCGIVKNDLMVRVTNEKYNECLEMAHVRKMDFTGKTMKGFIYISPEGFESDEDLLKWLLLGIEYVS